MAKATRQPRMAVRVAALTPGASGCAPAALPGNHVAQNEAAIGHIV